MQGNDLFSRFLPDLTEALHRQMDYAFTMTKNTYGAKLKNIDTMMFRHSISVYLQQIHGIRDDQYDYSKINKWLLQIQKSYIKNAGCLQKKVSFEDFINLSGQLESSEKCHVCILIMETKKKIELLYLSKAVNQFLNSQ